MIIHPHVCFHSTLSTEEVKNNGGNVSRRMIGFSWTFLAGKRCKFFHMSKYVLYNRGLYVLSTLASTQILSGGQEKRFLWRVCTLPAVIFAIHQHRNLIKKIPVIDWFPSQIVFAWLQFFRETFKTRCHRINTESGSESSTRQWCLRLLIGHNWPIYTFNTFIDISIYYHTDHSARLCKTLSIDGLNATNMTQGDLRMTVDD